MKRFISFVFAAALLLSFAAVGLAQESTKKTEKKPAPTSTEHKAMMEQKAAMTATETLQLNKDDITALQNALIKAKAYKGKPNGMLDLATKDAIRNYQKANKLKVTGEPNQETLHKLGVSYTHNETHGVAQPMAHPADVKQPAAKKTEPAPSKPDSKQN